MSASARQAATASSVGNTTGKPSVQPFSRQRLGLAEIPSTERSGLEKSHHNHP